MKQPCQRDCSRRCPGCGATCPDWAKWEAWKEQEYKKRLMKAEVGYALEDGWKRKGRTLTQK